MKAKNKLKEKGQAKKISIDNEKQHSENTIFFGSKWKWKEDKKVKTGYQKMKN